MTGIRIDQKWTSLQLQTRMNALVSGSTCRELLTLLRASETNFDAITQALRAEPYLSVKMTALANLVHGGRHPIDTLDRAVQVLGLRQVHAVVVSCLLTLMLHSTAPPTRRNRPLWRWVLGSATAAHWLSTSRDEAIANRAGRRRSARSASSAGGEVDGEETRRDTRGDMRGGKRGGAGQPNDEAPADVAPETQNTMAPFGLTVAIGALILHAGLGERYEALLQNPLRLHGLWAREVNALGVTHDDVTRWALLEMGCPERVIPFDPPMNEQTRFIPEPRPGAEAEGQDEHRLLATRAAQVLGGRLAGLDILETEAWLCDALPRLGLSWDRMQADLARWTTACAALAATLDIDAGSWSPEHERDHLLQDAAMLLERTAVDRLLLDQTMTSVGVTEAASAAAREIARSQANQDPLTQVLNRRGLAAALGELASASQQRQIAVMMIDVDRLKQINDSCGHSAGDRAIQATARAMEAIRPAATAVARYGGDEFICLLDVTDAGLAGADAWVTRLQLELQRLASIGWPAVCISVGTATGASHLLLDQWDQLCEAADQQLYEAKRARDEAAGDDANQLAGSHPHCEREP